VYNYNKQDPLIMTGLIAGAQRNLRFLRLVACEFRGSVLTGDVNRGLCSSRLPTDPERAEALPTTDNCAGIFLLSLPDGESLNQSGSVL
jgi:hypothetical protein